MLATDQVRLGQRNGAAEIAGHSGHFQRRIKIWSLWKPWTCFRVFRDYSSTLGIYSIEQIINRGHIGYGDRHLVVVNSTDYAKVTTERQCYSMKVHVFKTNNFSYTAKVAKSTSYI
ncbi:hypothetical protein [Rickettsiella endosymbiont of Xylota segnis]|uniref:hypothetical protein n=1 Tax=Rickettsiella endosymbiont of Xylota segnis TaxID=3066238 RepID=UPI0030D32255